MLRHQGFDAKHKTSGFFLHVLCSLSIHEILVRVPGLHFLPSGLSSSYFSAHSRTVLAVCHKSLSQLLEIRQTSPAAQRSQLCRPMWSRKSVLEYPLKSKRENTVDEPYNISSKHWLIFSLYLQPCDSFSKE